MVQTPTRPMMLEAFLQQPETKPASEYIDGKIVQKPMTGANHSVLQGELTTAINATLKETRKGFAFPELHCTFDNRSIVPDIAVLSWSQIPRNEEGKLAGDFLSSPAWMIEILSPEQSITRTIKKFVHALEQGTQMSWLVDPLEECVLVFAPGSCMQIFEAHNAQLPVPKFATAFQLTVGELIAWLYE